MSLKNHTWWGLRKGATADATAPSASAVDTTRSDSPAPPLDETATAEKRPNRLPFSPLLFPRLVKTAVLAIGISLVALSLWASRNPGNPPSLWAWASLAGGLFLIIVARRSVGRDDLPDWVRASLHSLQTRLGITDWQAACLLISPLAVAAAVAGAGIEWKMKLPVLAVGGWLLGMGLAVAGGWSLELPRLRLSKEAALFTLELILIAFVIRGWNTGHIPNALSGDEGSAGLDAVSFLKGYFDNIFRVGWFSFPSLYFFLQSLTLRLFGQTIEALRLFSALAGALTVGAVYLAARAMFGARAGLYAGLFLLAFHYHNHFSRIGLNNIWDGLWFTVALGALWVGWQREDRRLLLLSGLAVGLAQYFYVSARLLLGLVPLWLILAGLLDRPRLKRLLPALALAAWAALAAYLPLLVFYLRYPAEFLAPMTRVTIMGDWMKNAVVQTGQAPWQIVLHQIGLSFGGFAHLPLHMWYDPGTPLLRPVPATLFFIGAGLLLVKWKDNRTLLLALWVVAFGVMGGFSESTPAAQRYVAVAPAVAILVGYGLAETLEVLRLLWKGPVGVFEVVGLGLILLLCASELTFYFGDYTPRNDFGGEHTQVAQELVYYLHDKEAEWQVLFFGFPEMGYYSIASLPYLVPQIKALDINTAWRDPVTPRPASGPAIFVFLRDHQADLEAVRQDYPNGKLVTQYSRSGNFLYWLYEFPSAP